MLSYAVAVLLSYLAMAASRETIRPMPTITNSLVNLGKMEISFYFNGNGRDTPSHQPNSQSSRPISTFMKPETVPDEACPCSSLRNVKDSFLSNPTGMLNKILMNNDLFSYNKDPVTSSLCCESHEHVQEGTLIFEFPANPKNLKPAVTRSNPVPVQTNTVPITNKAMAMPMMPFLFDSIIPKKSKPSPLKTKSIEIFLFPKKKDIFNTQKLSSKKKDLVSKDNIQIVGDKEIKDAVNLFKPVLPVVKKYLNIQEKNEKLKEKEQEIEKKKEENDKEENGKEENAKEEGDQIIIEPASKPNAV